MTLRISVLALAATLLAACGTIPVERKNNCACNWKQIEIVPTGDVA
jgi:hypothetical protein